MDLIHTRKLLESLFPFVLEIRTFTDEDEVFQNVILHTNGQPTDAEYIEGLIRGKTPDQLYEQTLRIPRVESKPYHSGYTLRFRALYFDEVETILKALAGE